ncbi:hypothetical protein IEQ34_026324 [Dendrobium chrysotoxum]|uniref:Uncharacterized protein n=1 Tax=Dendrobium chrysotoxum TaxID=161865 RepID=A0AAV7FMQ2_DENCH|nr:hypothetical protein IEQ34_026324 [Dendrobium chrysotoxum]
MVEAQCSVQLTFPVILKSASMIYSVGVSVFLGGNKPSRTGDVRVRTSHPPFLGGLCLEEISYLQEQGPVVEDVSTILEIEQRAHENGLQENYYWLDRILRSYQSRAYFGDLNASFEIQEEGRTKVRKCLTPSSMLLALQRILPFPCKNQYTLVILMPQTSRIKLLKSSFLFSSNGFSRDAKILAGAAGGLILAISLWRYYRSTMNS